ATRTDRPAHSHPAQHALASATVLHARCADADAYATTLMVLGPDAGYAFAVEHNLAACLIEHGPGETFTEKRTPAFEAYQNQP
ncbi:MAG: FAD:protein FMN transferase ApbE, partial [Candidatus Competibacteraceae bacterium]|nr:FAD:protein FMN transferase ApbE [Candidatus Competibacteraceae bacterium]